MTPCPTCGAENVEGAQFCTKCGATLPASEPTTFPPPPNSEYTPTGGYGTYNQPQTPMAYQQAGTPQQSEPMHPALPAIVSLFFPGAGLFFVPGKAGLGAIALAGWVCWLVIVITLSFFLVGLCLFPISILIHVAAALYSYDAAAKASGGRWEPLVFKG